MNRNNLKKTAAEQLITNWNDPPAKYRPQPFYSWNDRLDVKELKRQITLMHDAGLGGFFMHARGGLPDTYMDNEYMDAVCGAIEAAVENNMEAWLYDENGWPSGCGNDAVPHYGEEFQQKKLLYCPLDGSVPLPEKRFILNYFDADGNVTTPDSPQSEYAVYYKLIPSYVDVLNPQTIEKFLESTHKVYRRCLPEKYFRQIKGFFTDEPEIAFSGVPWSPALVEKFAGFTGKNLYEHLLELFLDVKDYRTTRSFFYRATGVLFAENFHAELKNFCAANQQSITGHNLWEESLYGEIAPNGSVMRQYLEYHIPGIDQLGRCPERITAMVKLASAAAQNGSPRMLAETLGACGWGVSFAEMRSVVHSLLLKGINLFCWHLSAYSLRGLRKRDYPASYSLHQPWYRVFKHFNDYTARLSMLMAETHNTVDTAFISPLHTAWCNFRGEFEPNSNLLNLQTTCEQYSEAFDRLGIGYHYLDETVIDKLACGVIEGKMQVGACKYSTLILLPDSNIIGGKLYEYLQKFTASGGKLYSFNSDLSVVSDKGCEKIPLSKTTRFYNDIQELCQMVIPAAFQLNAVLPTTPVPERCQFNSQLAQVGRTLRCASNGNMYGWFVNLDLQQPVSFESDLPEMFKNKKLLKLDAQNGTVRILEHDSYTLAITLPPGGSLLIGTTDTEDPEAETAISKCKSYHPFFRFPDGSWKLSFPGKNFLPLDYCRLTVHNVGKPVTEIMPVISVQEYLMSWDKDLDVTLEFDFFISEAAEKNDFELILENPEAFTIKLNGAHINTADSGRTLFDPSWHCIKLENLQYCSNKLSLQCCFVQSPAVRKNYQSALTHEVHRNRFYYDMELETPILCGNFAVTSSAAREIPEKAWALQKPFSIDKLPEEFDISKLDLTGMPFFAGELTLQQRFNWQWSDVGSAKQFYLCCSKLHTQALEVKLNGKKLGFILYAEDKLLLNDGLKNGENLLEITLLSNLRNLLGPHHSADGDLTWVGPACFFERPGIYVRQPLPWTDEYIISRFGIEQLEVLCSE
ncbi:MAG: hypothetical protein E7052_10885 [Lentisphaerae bacterium]|nr:hypothetical protein [Lentisphaerota bacterium]